MVSSSFKVEASDAPKGFPPLEKGKVSDPSTSGLGFGRDFCWELIYGENCTVK